MMSAAIALFFAPLLALAEEAGEAEAAARDSRKGNIVLLIGVGDNATVREMERRLATELSLNAGSFRVEQVPAGIDGFVEMTLDRQIEHIGVIIEQKGAMAAMWLNTAAEDHLLLQIVALDIGRSVVRLLKQKRHAGAVNELAVTAAGLLDTPYPSVATPEEAPRPPANDGAGENSPPQHVDGPQPAAPPADGPAETPRTSKREPPTRRWHLMLSVAQEGPVTGQRGPGLGTGGLLDAERTLSEGISIDAGLGGAFQPFGDRHSPIRGGWRLWAETRALVLFTAGRVKIGPLLGMDGGINGTIVEDAPYPRRLLTFWNIRGQFGAALRIAVLRKQWISVASGLFATPTRITIRRESNDDILGRTAVLGWWLRLEMGLF